MIAFPLLCQIMTSHRSIVKCRVHDEAPKDYAFWGLMTATTGRKLLSGPGVVAPLSSSLSSQAASTSRRSTHIDSCS